MEKSHHSVAIRYYDNAACSAVKQLAAPPTLSNQALIFLETRRFLVSEVPRLPLGGCTAEACRCRYVHYADRRGPDRRHTYVQFSSAKLALGRQDRRTRLSRRQSDSASPRQPGV